MNKTVIVTIAKTSARVRIATHAIGMLATITISPTTGSAMNGK